MELAPGIGDDIFVKLFTHEAQDRNSAALLRDVLETAFNPLVEAVDRRGRCVHFVSAWQIYLAIDTIRQSPDPVAAAQAG